MGYIQLSSVRAALPFSILKPEPPMSEVVGQHEGLGDHHFCPAA